MKHFFHLFLHELRMLLIAPASYIASTLFLLIMIYLYFFSLHSASQEVREILPTEIFFQFFWIPVIFMVPLLTMRSIAEERNLGTLETLMTTPASAFEIVLSKFIGAYLFYIMLWSLTLAFPLITTYLVPGQDVSTYLLNKPSLIGGYSFIAVSGTLYVSLGIFASSLTRSQLVAGMLSFFLLFFIILCGLLILNLPTFNAVSVAWVQDPLDYIRTFKHLEDFGHGVIDSRPFLLYLSTTLLFLGLTTLVVEAKV